MLKNREEIKIQWITNSNEHFKIVKFRKIEACEIDRVVFKCFCSVRRNISASSVLLKIGWL